jgi:aspartate dehydrogenase
MASVGALAHAGRNQTLCRAARAGQCKLNVPAGAVASLDYLRAVARVKDKQVLQESRKPPAAWMDELQKQSIDLPLKGPMVLFEGDAQEAAYRYTQNLNVAASLALAGVGFEKTRVRIVADPAAIGNTHHLEFSGAFGTLNTHIVNHPSPANPKTSWVVGLSLLASRDSYFSQVVIG